MKITDYGEWVRVSVHGQNGSSEQFWFRGNFVPIDFYEDYELGKRFLIAYFSDSSEPVAFESVILREL